LLQEGRGATDNPENKRNATAHRGKGGGGTDSRLIGNTNDWKRASSPTTPKNYAISGPSKRGNHAKISRKTRFKRSQRAPLGGGKRPATDSVWTRIKGGKGGERRRSALIGLQGIWEGEADREKIRKSRTRIITKQ